MTGPYEALFKRPIDGTAALLGLVAALPLMAVSALAIWVDDRGTIIFRQRRVGAAGREFTIFKFRSMRENVGDLPSHQAARLPITRVGRVLRRTNLDELPQLWNVVRGDMSVVGPRPALPTQEELLQARSASRTALIRPGLTGLAQVSSYDGMPAARKAEFDARYASRITLIGDASILLRTVGYLIRRPPVY